MVTGAVSFTRLSDNFIKGPESKTFVLVVLGFTYMLKKVQGALASASVWGNASCLFSDNRVIVARATESDLILPGVTQMPYQIIVLTASTILILIAGLIL